MPSTTTKYPLANNDQGLGFELGESAVYWRVSRRTGRQGKQTPIPTANGPLEIPITATLSDLRAAVAEAADLASQPRWKSGKFTLRAVDVNGKPVGSTCAVAELIGDGGAQSDDDDDSGGGAASTGSGEFHHAVKALKETIETLRVRDSETMAALRQRDNESLNALRESNKVLTEALAATTKALAGGYNSSMVTPPVVVPQPQAAPTQEATDADEAPPEKSAMEQINEFMANAPMYIAMIQQLMDALKKNGVNKSHGANGVINPSATDTGSGA